MLEAEITVLGEYRPWGWHKEQGGNGGDYPVHSSRVLDLKKRYERGLRYFADYMVPRIKTAYAIAVVPSHDAAKASKSGVHDLADRLIEKLHGLTSAGACLVRHTTVPKLATGGDRSIETHLNSIRVDNVDRIRGRVVLLLDDVTTSGNSLLACRRLLLEAGAADVKLVALARTTH
ncbi:hypothetical protein G7077_07005 [Sphingomonas piscis]|uniref:Phosphoribosyltransferase domain-containing protein n=1 Tax=Sphingomonas piscis TaxID=2714943 RepID=A0A6G7YPL6_9SPHN|nr:phosphoribosyltransferase family protein [Sphingomonas piscis]QIK78683.1 hypothetical protein G7077_07005 [Sphingomonas piscis]